MRGGLFAVVYIINTGRKKNSPRVCPTLSPINYRRVNRPRLPVFIPPTKKVDKEESTSWPDRMKTVSINRRYIRHRNSTLIPDDFINCFFFIVWPSIQVRLNYIDKYSTSYYENIISQNMIGKRVTGIFPMYLNSNKIDGQENCTFNVSDWEVSFKTNLLL